MAVPDARQRGGVGPALKKGKHMANHKTPILGLCPIGKFVFSHEDASRFKGLIRQRLDRWQVRDVNLERVLPDGMVRDQKHVAPVVRHFQQQGIDALFIPHCNFGTEGAAAMIAKQCGVPTLLWGPRDEAPWKTAAARFALRHAGHQRRAQHPPRAVQLYRKLPYRRAAVRAGRCRFLRAAAVVKTVKTMKIGQIGQRIDFFWSTIVNEAEMRERFGIQVLPIDAVNLIRSIRSRVSAERGKYQEELAQFRKWISFNHFTDEDGILASLAFRDLVVEIAQRENLNGLCFQTFDSFPAEFRASMCFGCSLIDDAGYPVAPESDLQGAISSVILEAAGGTDEPSFLPDITIRHPANDNAVLLWHADCAVLATDAGLGRKVGPALDPQGPAERLGAFPAQGRPLDALPLRRPRRRLPAGFRRGPHGARAVHAGVLLVAGG